ncbi:unnamed protein product [marine sediment metagenome]|uniref:Uncharacterized protein n=1 Tax=marine sediment metagenome TaxID=412755 RepID=X1IT17_9ZZZZ
MSFFLVKNKKKITSKKHKKYSEIKEVDFFAGEFFLVKNKKK